MFGDPADYKDGPTLFATHSTHKLLAALSQASFIHVRDGRDPIEDARFNEFVHDARVNITVLSYYCVERDFRCHDGRRERRSTDNQVHPGSSEFSTDCRPHQSAIRAKPTTGSSAHGTRLR